jgi:mono/diheme cytochrome c family protein
MVSPLYGPELSRSSLGGQDTVMRDVISNGTPRMPGFKYHFEPAQIDAIVAYLKTIPTPPAPAPAAPVR